LIIFNKELPRQLGHVAAVVALAGALTAVTAFLSLRLAQQFGRLSVPPLYDDVSYFVAAARWLDAAPTHGLAANLYGLLQQHAPFSTLTAIVGFTLVPDSYLGPYAVNAVVILAFLLGIARLTWQRPFVNIATCLVAAASVPVFWQTMTEARPDLPWGLALGLATGAVLYRPLLKRSRWSIFILGVLCGLAASIKPSAFPASLTLMVLAAGAQLVCECLESDARTFRAAVTRAGLPALIFAAGLLAGAALIGVELVNTIHYILNTMLYDRDFWVTDESVRASLLHYSIGREGRLALNYWLWIGLALFMARLGLALLNDRRDVARSITLLVAVLVAHAIPTLSNVKSYFLGAMFYGPFIVAMLLNFCAVVAGLDAALSRLTLKPELLRWLISGLHLLPLAVVLSMFVHNCLPARVELATRLSQDEIHDIGAATEKVWSLLQQKSLMRDVAPSFQPGKVPVVSFSSPHPVTSSTIQLYAVQARMPLDVRGEYLTRTVEAAETALLASDVAVVTSSIPHNLPGPRMGDELIRRLDANPDMCLVASLPLLSAREIRIYRRGDSGCGSLAPDSHQVRAGVRLTGVRPLIGVPFVAR
jgi:hypothetical protein